MAIKKIQTVSSRRKFLCLFATSVAVGLTNMGLPAFASGNRAQVRVGVQLYTLRSLMEKDVRKTLQQVAATGYSEVELAGYYDHSPSELRRILDGEGLSAPASHIALDMLDQQFDAVLAGAMVLGNEYIVLPYLFEHQRTSIDDYKRLADKMNHWGEACQKAGIRFAYHNHDFEFMPLDSELPYNIILQQTDRQTAFLELDLYWATKAGQDPVALFEDNPGRFPLWHVKDMAVDGSIVDVGDGVIDFPRIFSAANQAGLEHGIIEHDTTTNPQATIRKGLATVKKLVVGT
jgi:sugar phosphate isomerase/epimerase